MALNDSASSVITDSRQKSVDVKEEGAEILSTSNEQCNSGEANTKSDVDKFVQELSPDELDLSIEVFKELQKALTNPNESERIGELPKSDRGIKLKKESGTVLNDAEKFPSQLLSSSGSNSDTNEDKFIQGLRDDEIDFSIAIVKLLQEALVDADGIEKIGESRESAQEVKEEKKSKIKLSDPLKGLEEQKPFSQGAYSTVPYIDRKVAELGIKLSHEEMKLSMEIIEQIQNALVQIDESEDSGNCSKSLRDIEQEQQSESEITNPGDCSEDQKSNLVDYSRSHNLSCDIIVKCKEYENLYQESSSIESSGFTNCTYLLPSDTENRGGNSGSNYKIVGTSSSIKQGRSENTSDIISTQLTHTGEKPFDYNRCLAKFSRKCVLKQQLRNHRAERPFDCKRCGAKFKKKCAVKQHIRIHTGERPFDCNTCGAKFARNWVLKEHMRKHTGERHFNCNSCGAKFAGKNDLVKHMRIHTGERPFDCKCCGLKFTQKINLKRHMRIHTGERPFDCKYCGLKFTQKVQLEKHMRIHTGERPFDCNTCGAKFTQKSAVKEHMRIHTGERPFDCKRCGTKFTQKSSLKLHLRIHTGERPFDCKTCGLKFAQKIHLKSHVRIHTGEKPFDCNTCGGKFTRKNVLKEHMRIHTGENLFDCKRCRTKFVRKSALKQHMRIHTG